MPPSQWVKQRQSWIGSGSTSTSVRMVAPVVVKPEAALEDGVGDARGSTPDQTNGSAPKTAAANQARTTRSSASRCLSSCSGRGSDREERARRRPPVTSAATETRAARPAGAGERAPGDREQHGGGEGEEELSEDEAEGRPADEQGSGPSRTPRGRPTRAPAPRSRARRRCTRSPAPDLHLAAGHERLAVGAHDRPHDRPAREAEVAQLPPDVLRLLGGDQLDRLRLLLAEGGDREHPSPSARTGGSGPPRPGAGSPWCAPRAAGPGAGSSGG